MVHLKDTGKKSARPSEVPKDESQEEKVPEGDDRRGGNDKDSLDEPQDPYPYTVSEGDTLESIGKDYILRPQTLREANDLDPDEEIKPGQVILVPLNTL